MRHPAVSADSRERIICNFDIHKCGSLEEVDFPVLGLPARAIDTLIEVHIRVFEQALGPLQLLHLSRCNARVGKIKTNRADRASAVLFR